MIRTAALKDIPVLADHHELMFREIFNYDKIEINETSIHRMKQNYIKKLKKEINKNCFAWLIEIRGKVVASAAITFISLVPTPYDENTDTGYLHSVYTDKEYRKKGYAEKLIKTILKHCKNNGIKRVDLVASKAGKGIYKRNGFNNLDNFMRYIDR